VRRQECGAASSLEELAGGGVVLVVNNEIRVPSARVYQNHARFPYRIASWSLLPERPSVWRTSGMASRRSWSSLRAWRWRERRVDSLSGESPLLARVSCASCTSSRRRE